VLVCQFTVTAVHIDTSSLTSKHCTPMMPECGFSCQQWHHYWRWKCVQCTSETQEPRQGWVPLLTNLNSDTDIRETANTPWLYMWQEVHGRYDRDCSGLLTAGWRGNCRQAFRYVWGLQWHTIRWQCILCNQMTEVVWNFFFPFCVFTFLFFFLFSIFQFRFCFSGFSRFCLR